MAATVGMAGIHWPNSGCPIRDPGGDHFRLVILTGSGMLARMWQLSIPWWELILRVVIIYAFLLVLLRLSGKRQVGQLAPFDLVLLLVLSNSVQNAMNGGDNSLLAGLISAGV